MMLFRRPIKSLLIYLVLVLSNQEHVSATVTFPTFFRDYMIMKQKTAVAFWDWSSPGANVKAMATDCQLLQFTIFSNEIYNNDG